MMKLVTFKLREGNERTKRPAKLVILQDILETTL